MYDAYSTAAPASGGFRASNASEKPVKICIDMMPEAMPRRRNTRGAESTAIACVSCDTEKMEPMVSVSALRLFLKKTLKNGLIAPVARLHKIRAARKRNTNGSRG